MENVLKIIYVGQTLLEEKLKEQTPQMTCEWYELKDLLNMSYGWKCSNGMHMSIESEWSMNFMKLRNFIAESLPEAYRGRPIEIMCISHNTPLWHIKQAIADADMIFFQAGCEHDLLGIIAGELGVCVIKDHDNTVEIQYPGSVLH